MNRRRLSVIRLEKGQRTYPYLSPSESQPAARSTWFVALIPYHCVSITRSVVDVHCHIRVSFLVIIEGSSHAAAASSSHMMYRRRPAMRIFRDVLRNAEFLPSQCLHHLQCQLHFDGDIRRSADNLLPRSPQHDMRSFGIKPEIKFMPRVVDELRIVRAGVQTSAHKDQFSRQFWKLRIDRQWRVPRLSSARLRKSSLHAGTCRTMRIRKCTASSSAAFSAGCPSANAGTSR